MVGRLEVVINQSEKDGSTEMSISSSSRERSSALNAVSSRLAQGGASFGPNRTVPPHDADARSRERELEVKLLLKSTEAKSCTPT